MEGERTILQADNGTLTITTHRVRYLAKRTGNAKFISMMLDAVTSCEVTHRSYPALLVLAAVVFLAGIMMNTPRDQSPSAYGLLLAIIIVFAYLGTRRQVVRISSPSAHIDVLLSGMKFEQALGAVEAVETAKDLRYRLA